MTATVTPLPAPPNPVDRVIAAHANRPKCPTLGHEYNFGICLDCEQVDPAFEPDDDMITADYLRGYDRQAAA